MENKKLLYGDKEYWTEKAWKHQKAKQGLMLKKIYPEYTTTDYVVWIIADLYFEDDILQDSEKKISIEGDIQIIKKDGKKTKLQSKVKKPYPNKRLHQVTMMNGRKRGFGTPLLFKTFEELSEIKEISITWKITFSNKGNEIFAYQIYRELYQVQFLQDKESKEKVYTLQTKNILGTGMFDTELAEPTNQEKVFEYLANFDNTKQIVLNPENGFKERNVLYNLNENGEIIPEIRAVESLNYKNGLSKLKEYIKEDTKPPFTFCMVTLEKETCLNAHYMANILAESCFGFPDISNDELEKLYEKLL